MGKLYNALRQHTMVPEETFYANLDIAKLVKDIPGCVVECGVWKGGMIAGLSIVMGFTRHYFLFDSFEGLPPAEEIDGEKALAYQQNTQAPDYYDNCRANVDDALLAMHIVGSPKHTIVQGWFSDTIPSYQFPSPIALLRLDGDWYSSTKTCLENLYDKVAHGGMIIIDDFHAWEGCRKAVDEFFTPRSVSYNVEDKYSLCWVIKP